MYSAKAALIPGVACSRGILVIASSRAARIVWIKAGLKLGMATSGSHSSIIPKNSGTMASKDFVKLGIQSVNERHVPSPRPQARPMLICTDPEAPADWFEKFEKVFRRLK